VAEYARAAGVKVSDLYSGKQALVRKGVVADSAYGAGKEIPETTARRFVPVKVVNDGFRVGTAVACQIRYPSGVMIECSGLPPARWITAVVGGQGYVPT